MTPTAATLLVIALLALLPAVIPGLDRLNQRRPG
jgi:hypothetical protein